MVVMVVVFAVLDMPDDAANDPVMVVMMVMMEAAMVMMIARQLHVAVRPAGRVLLRVARHRGIGRPQRHNGIRDRGEQLGE